MSGYLAFSMEDQNGIDIASPSDLSCDLLVARRSLNHGCQDSPADVKIVKDCIIKVTSTKSVNQDVTMQLDSIATVVNGNSLNDNCIQNGHLVYSALQNGRFDVEQDNAYSGDPSNCDSSDKSSSVGSSEMIIRGNSFLLHESDQLLSVSLLGESSNRPDLDMTPGLLPDVCEGLIGNKTRASGDEPRHQEFGVTFIQPCNQTFVMEEEGFQPCIGSSVPQRGTCESRTSGTEHTECVTPVNCNKTNIEAQRSQCPTGGSNQSTPAEGETFQLPASEELDISGNVQTSTPVQCLNSKTFCLPSFSDSPHRRSKINSGSHVAQVTKKQQKASSQKPKAPMITPTKNIKSEIKKFAKPDFNNVKSKIITKPTSASMPSSVSVVKPSSTVSHQVAKTLSAKTSNSIQPRVSPMSASGTKATSFHNNLMKEQSSMKHVRSSTYQGRAPPTTSQPRTWSDTPPSSKTPGEELHVSQTKNSEKSLSGVAVENQNGPDRLLFSREQQQAEETHNERRKHQKSSPKADAAVCDRSKDRIGPQPPSTRAGGVPGVRTPAASLRLPPPSASKLKPGTGGKYGCPTADVPKPRSKLTSSGGNSKMRLPDASSKLPVKTRIHNRNSNANDAAKTDCVEPSPGGFTRPTTNKATSVRTRLQSQPPGAVSSSGCKNTSTSSVGSVRSTSTLLKTPASTRLPRVSSASSVDKSKSKASAQSQQQSQTSGRADVAPPETKPRGVGYYKALCEKKNQTIQQLKNHFLSSNCRFEAISVVVQNLSAKHEEAVKQRQGLTAELLNLKEELDELNKFVSAVTSVQSCERLEQEAEEQRSAFDGELQKIQEQHRADLADLEERLKTFYSAEWEKIHQTYQEQADKCKMEMEQQLAELRAKHETMKKELDVSHEEKVESLKQHYEGLFEELKISHEQDVQTLEKTLKEAETTLSNQIEELTTENTVLSERLKAEEDRRRALSMKCQDSHTLYLEQELESLKVVLDIKNKQIHQQEKKLMQMDLLMEKNVKMEECLNKVQQDNEDLMARINRHAALSRQLSTEQAVLQESLQKETKANKRLSMENEELLWKLQNVDLSSPQKISSPTPSMTFQSPRNSGLLFSPPISPR